MTTEALVQSAQALLAPWAQSTATPDPTRLDVTLQVDDLPAAARALHDGQWGYLAAVTGLDRGPASGQFEVLYHFCNGAAVATLRVSTPQAEPSVPTIATIIPPASLYERELMEMFGVTVVGTPNTDRLFVSDSFPAGEYPMRKGFGAPEVTA